MSYCRFSSNGYQCDLYAFEDKDAGLYTIHVAESRYMEQGPKIEDYVRMNKRGTDVLKSSIDRFNKATRRWIQKGVNKEKINISPYDGMSLHFVHLGEFRSMMLKLYELGYMFDIGVIAILNDEVTEKGRYYTLTETEK